MDRRIMKKLKYMYFENEKIISRNYNGNKK